MSIPPPFRLLFFLAVALVACSPRGEGELVATTLESLYPSPAAPTDLPSVTGDGPTSVGSQQDQNQLETITIPISIYIVDDQEGQLSSTRTVEQLEGIYEKVNEIWAPAGIVIDVRSIQRVQFPQSVLSSIVNGDFRPLRDNVGRDFDIPDPSLLNGFYAQEIGGPNGIVPFDARLFFVNDNPSVHHERVTSHEIGHILGLHHTLFDQGRLMFSGTNGMNLTDEEITVARYYAQGILDRLR